MHTNQSDFQQVIIELVPSIITDQSLVDNLLRSWDEYFSRLGIYTEEAKVREFEALQRVYLSSGIMSIAPPEISAHLQISKRSTR